MSWCFFCERALSSALRNRRPLVPGNPWGAPPSSAQPQLSRWSMGDFYLKLKLITDHEVRTSKASWRNRGFGGGKRTEFAGTHVLSHTYDESFKIGPWNLGGETQINDGRRRRDGRGGAWNSSLWRQKWTSRAGFAVIMIWTPFRGPLSVPGVKSSSEEWHFAMVIREKFWWKMRIDPYNYNIKRYDFFCSPEGAHRTGACRWWPFSIRSLFVDLGLYF